MAKNNKRQRLQGPRPLAKHLVPYKPGVNPKSAQESLSAGVTHYTNKKGEEVGLRQIDNPRRQSKYPLSHGNTETVANRKVTRGPQRDAWYSAPDREVEAKKIIKDIKAYNAGKNELGKKLDQKHPLYRRVEHRIRIADPIWKGQTDISPHDPENLIWTNNKQWPIKDASERKFHKDFVHEVDSFGNIKKIPRDKFDIVQDVAEQGEVVNGDDNRNGKNGKNGKNGTNGNGARIGQRTRKLARNVAGLAIGGSAFMPTKSGAEEIQTHTDKGEYGKAAKAYGKDILVGHSSSRLASGVLKKLKTPATKLLISKGISKAVARQALRIAGRQLVKKSVALAAGPAAPAVMTALLIKDAYDVANVISGGKVAAELKPRKINTKRSRYNRKKL